MAKERNAAYFRRRLKRDHPAIFADLEEGRYRSTRAAAAAAGLIRLPSRLDALKREWSKASTSERAEFLASIGMSAVGHKSTASTTSAALPAIADPDGRLLPSAVSFLRTWLGARGLRPGRIIEQLGGSYHDYRMAEALERGKPLRADLLHKLGPWMRAEGFKP